jgi:hypothetical protein
MKMTDEMVVEEVVEEKASKRGKWTRESAINFLSKNGQDVGTKVVQMTDKAGIGCYGAAVYLHSKHGFVVLNPVKKVEEPSKNKRK